MPSLILLILFTALLLGAGIWLTLKKKYHIFYFIICGVFITIFCLLMRHVFPQSAVMVEMDGPGIRDTSEEDLQATLSALMIGLLCVIPVLSFVNFFLRKKNVVAIILSALMLVFCAVLFAIWYFLDHLGKIGG